MKIGIITFQNAHNWGAALQAYALKEYLKSQGHEVKIINYINKEIAKSYSENGKVYLKFKTIRGVLIYIQDVINSIYGRKECKQKWDKFKEFEKTLLDNDIKEYSVEEIEKLEIDAYLCGSDQIWNPGLTGGLDKIYFANFKTNAKKISYAASIGVKKLSEENEILFKEYINNLDKISVREESLKEYAQKFTDKEVVKVLDPTLLLDVEKYESMSTKPKEYKYLFLYTLIENKKLYNIAKKIAKENNLKIIELVYCKNIKKCLHNQIANIGPKEFLGLIKNAECVVTNSFHGTIFSILFKKNFYTINAGSVNSRIENILNIANIPERCIIKYEDLKNIKEINYNSVFENLKKEINVSKEFINNALK